MRDMHNNISVLHAITPQTVSTTGAANGRLSAALDRRGFESVEFIYSSGASATVADTITPVILECDTVSGTYTSVANGDLLGAETALTLTAAKTGRVGYNGNKRFLKIRLFGIGTATAIVAATAVLATPAVRPQA
jgi:hypothetical protein